jgi:hypothetical protein
MNNESFVNDSLENEIINIVIPSIFPNLNSNEVKLLSNYVVKLINVISVCFQFDPQVYDNYIYQFRQGNYKDIKWLIAHILPFINTDSNFEGIYSLSDIYTKKKIQSDINKQEPQYVYSNVQYNKFIRTPGDYKEREFNIKEVEQNYYLLINSILCSSNRLCANWINILPYTMNDYFNSRLYQKTLTKFIRKELVYFNPIEMCNLELSDEKMYRNLSVYDNLFIGHIYEEIADLYYSIKTWKWTLYNIIIEGDTFTMTDFLRQTFDIPLLLEFQKWEDVVEGKKVVFRNVYTEMISNLDERSDRTRFGVFFTFARSIVLGFEKSTMKYDARKEKYISLRGFSEIGDQDYDDEEDEKISQKFSVKDIIISFSSLGAKFLYEFIAESLQKLKRTWYGYVLFNDSKTDLIDFDTESSIGVRFRSIKPSLINENKDIYYQEMQLNDINNAILLGILKNESINLQPKNIYNFAKSFCHIGTGDNFRPLPKNWSSLTTEMRQIVINRLNGVSSPLEWLNITASIKRSRYTLPSSLALNRETAVLVNTIRIYNAIKGILIDIIFQSLIHKGTLTQFIPDKERSDLSILPGKTLDSLGRMQKQKDIFAENEDNKYWNAAYHYLTMRRFRDMPSYMYDKEKRSFFSFALKNLWFKAGAYDWIGQIGFCHHFINNRIIFLTAPTGVGKSTEIPKLLVYYSMVLDCNTAPKIACTQPRRKPVEAAGYVAATLGVPIQVDKENDPPSENYFVQFRHEKRSHVKNISLPILQYMTGDTLLYEINDPLIKKSTGNSYLPDNLYDTIIIDEAHEHVTYMDLLLSYFKLSISMNNSLKLVIVTATMDDDEYRYRRFYRDINDNRKYPLNMFIMENKLDRINVDRRYHYGVGRETNYPIVEHYRPLASDNNTEIEDQEIVRIVNEITSKASKGNILIFEPGEGEIKRIVELLNARTRPNVLAIPFFSKLSSDRQDMIEKIHIRGPDIKIGKNQDFARENPLVGPGRYDTFVIVATSIAEASITISNLKYVIDTGTVKKPVYDYRRRSEVLLKGDISESSRIQRRGRVGRRSPGEVYYLYKKGKMSSNRIQYEFSQRNIYDHLFRYLITNIEPVFLLSKYNLDSNSTVISYGQLQDELKQFSLFLEKQYFIEKTYFAYYGNDEFYDYNNYQPPVTYYKTGFDAKTLSDLQGKFYIIHPEELNLIRNINGDITGTIGNLKFKSISKYTGEIVSDKITSFWKILFDFLYVGTQGGKIIKTNMGIFFFEAAKVDDLKLIGHNLLRTLIFGVFTGSEGYMTHLCAMYEVLGFDITKLFVTDSQKKSSLPEVHSAFSSDSDSTSILRILQQFHNVILKRKGLAFSIDKKFLSEQDLDSDKIRLNIDESILLIQELVGSEKLMEKMTWKDRQSTQKKIKYSIIRNYTKAIESARNEIMNWCSSNKIDYNMIIRYTSKMAEFTMSLLTVKNNALNFIDVNENQINYLKEMKDKFSRIKIDPVYTSLIYGFPHNFVKKIKDSSFYLSLYSPELANTFSIAEFKPGLKKSLIKDEYTGNYILYLSNNIEKDELSCIHYITSSDILILVHMYTENLVIDTNRRDFIQRQIDKYEKEILPYRKSRHIDSNIRNRIANYTGTIEEIKIDFQRIKKLIKPNLEITKFIEPRVTEYIDLQEKEVTKFT